jgi:hypothetical protein
MRPIRARLAAALLALLLAGPAGAQSVFQPAPAYHAARTLAYEYLNTANGANTLYISTTELTLPANTFATNGDELLVEWLVTTDATAATRSYQCTLGYTAYDSTSGFTGGLSALSTTTATASVTYNMTARFRRLNATGAAGTGLAVIGTSNQARVWATAALTFSGALNLRCIVKSSVATAGVVTIQDYRVTWRPR